MTNQTISSDSNHDSLTGRAAGEDITINSGAKLTIDSCPHLTAMGILGDITLNSGEVHIDGRYVKKVAYSNGSGSRPTAIPQTVTWDSGASSGKVIRYDSGDSTSGVLTITVQIGTLDSSDSITDGSWTADVDSVEVGFLVVFGEDQVWGELDATCTLRITGDMYQIGIGTGADGQSITLPHSGVQAAVWVETGNGTGIYEIWHRVNTVASSVWYDAISDWGATYGSGKVFGQTPGSSTLTFGSSTNGGAPASGAKIVIPNVHMGTTTTGAPTTEYVGLTVGSTLELITASVSCNVYVDHLNASSVQLNLVGCNEVEVSNSCFTYWNATNVINRNNKPTTYDNCAWVAGNGLTGETAVLTFIIQDNVGGLTLTDCVIAAGANATSSASASLVTMANVTFTRCKFVGTQQDENSHAALRGSVALNVVVDDCYFVAAGIATIAGCVNWEITDLTWCDLSSRGSTEDSMVLINMTGTDTVLIDGGTFQTDGTASRHMNGGLAIFTDCSNIKMFNFGSVSSKIDCNARGTYVVSTAGITNNCEFKRLYFTDRNTALPFTTVASARNIVFENCSCDYNDELEMHNNSCIMKGVHGASGNIGAATGWEDDYPGVVDSLFYDCFKSDTTGGVGLIFTPPGEFFEDYFSITGGTPLFNGIGDLLMPGVSDEVVFEWPYWILGHTAFSNLLPHLLGVNAGTLGSSHGNFDVEYALDTGSGYGSWKAATAANLSAESIGPDGFKIKVRISVNTASATNAIRGLQIFTATTISDQAANLYPLVVVPVTITVLDAVSKDPVEGARVYLITDPGGVDIFNDNTDANGQVTTEVPYLADENVVGRVRKSSGSPYYRTSDITGEITSSGYQATTLLIHDDT